MSFKAVGTKVYAGNGALVRQYEAVGRSRWGLDLDVMNDLHARMRKARRFASSLNGTGPRAEHARRTIGT